MTTDKPAAGNVKDYVVRYRELEEYMRFRG